MPRALWKDHVLAEAPDWSAPDVDRFFVNRQQPLQSRFVCPDFETRLLKGAQLRLLLCSALVAREAVSSRASLLAAVLLSPIAFAASLVPARRAASVDPLDAARAE